MQQLRFTTTGPAFMAGIFETNESNPPLVIPEEKGELIRTKVKGRTAYIHLEAEILAGFDIPKFIDGGMGQLDLPIDEQDILMVLPSGEYPCISTYIKPDPKKWDENCYYITLKEKK